MFAFNTSSHPESVGGFVFVRARVFVLLNSRSRYELANVRLSV